MSVPAWTTSGVLPPVIGDDSTSKDRSPYDVVLSEFVSAFGTSQERCEILDGLLRYRAALRQSGMSEGFQWLGGSFVEDIELLESRSPNDIDVVTFFNLDYDAQVAAMNVAPELFAGDTSYLKDHFLVDGYYVFLGNDPTELVHDANYWGSLWAHRRNTVWKGFLRIKLTDEDNEALTALTGARAQL